MPYQRKHCALKGRGPGLLRPSHVRDQELNFIHSLNVVHTAVAASEMHNYPKEIHHCVLSACCDDGTKMLDEILSGILNRKANPKVP